MVISDLVEQFVKGTVRVMETMARMTPAVDTPYDKRPGSPSGDVTGVVGFMGGKHAGSVAVTFSAPCIKAALSNMLGEEVTELGPELLDAVGELTNMISGAVRVEISNSMGLELEAGIPTVICGQGHIVSHAANTSVLVIPFTTEHGAFCIEACFKEAKPRRE
ncbi:MAG: chemotaxis protein CheX [Pseudomonadota bacterium]